MKFQFRDPAFSTTFRVAQIKLVKEKVKKT
jgi:hypothetical protein